MRRLKEKSEEELKMEHVKAMKLQEAGLAVLAKVMAFPFIDCADTCKGLRSRILPAHFDHGKAKSRFLYGVELQKGLSLASN